MITKIIYTASIFPLILSIAAAEVVYLKNGKVLKGSIVNEAKTGITLKNEQGEQEILHRDIKRILYGNMDMELVFMLTSEGKIVRGYMVDQDDDKVVFREERESPDEKTMLKSNIREISRDRIYPVDLEVFLKPAGFLPVDAGGADLGPAVYYSAGMGFNSMIIANLRLLLESGFVRANSNSHNGQYLQILPVTLSAAYYMRLGIPKMALVPKLGAGMAFMTYNTGEGEELQSTAFEALAGAGLVYEIMKNTIYLGLWAEYMLYYDGSDYLQGTGLSLSIGYRM